MIYVEDFTLGACVGAPTIWVHVLPCRLGNKKRQSSELIATIVCRDREQIRSWLTSQEGLAYRDGLESVKRDIEAEMERFKILEKSLKVKAFSKEGLILQVTFLPFLNGRVMADAFTGSCFNEGLWRVCDTCLSSSHEWEVRYFFTPNLWMCPASHRSPGTSQDGRRALFKQSKLSPKASPSIQLIAESNSDQYDKSLNAGSRQSATPYRHVRSRGGDEVCWYGLRFLPTISVYTLSATHQT